MAAPHDVTVSVEEGEVILRAPKVVYVLTARDLLQLLISSPDAWRRAIKRGKCHRRRLATTRRENHG